MKPLEVLQTETLIDEKYCRILADTIEMPDGKKKIWYRQDKSDVVMVCPILKDGQVLLQKDYRYGAKTEMIEFCAGVCDAGETPLETIQREMAEETGYKSEKWTKIGEVYGNSTWSGAVLHFFVAEGCYRAQEQKLSGVEQIQVLPQKTLKEAKRVLLEDQKPTDAASIALFGFLPDEILTRYWE